jgi:hypothetical protein
MSHNTGIFWPGNTNAKFFWPSMASVTSVTSLSIIIDLILGQPSTLLARALMLYPDVRVGRLEAIGRTVQNCRTCDTPSGEVLRLHGIVILISDPSGAIAFLRKMGNDRFAPTVIRHDRGLNS